MFRVGDIVRGQVISLGDREGYYISTAGDKFGVLLAKSERGLPLVPINWREMVEVGGEDGDPAVERRKVARPM